MADLSDVLGALRDAIGRVLYPSGVPAGKAPPSVVGAPARVKVGWPDATLDADLAAGICLITVWPRPGMNRNVGPYLTGWTPRPRAVPPLAATVSGDTATFAGAAAVPGLVVGLLIDGAAAYGHAVQPGDTPETVAAALGALVAAGLPATADRPAVLPRPVVVAESSLTVPGAVEMLARVEAPRGERREMRRVRQSVQVTAWCPTPRLRDDIVRLVDAALLDERSLPLPDGTVATVSYEGTAYDEAARQQPLHRRDLLLAIEFATVADRVSPPVVLPGGAVVAQPEGGADAGSTPPADHPIRRIVLS